jgi:outer membrane protein OmpA-like peptidoglycan-associated protein
MSNNEPAQELEANSAARAPGNRAWIVAAASALLLAIVGGLAWYTQARVRDAERALATVTAERDAAVAAAAQEQARLDQIRTERDGVESRRLELEQQLEAARDELARLRTELESAKAAAAARLEAAPTPPQTPSATEQPASQPAVAEQPPSPAAPAPTASTAEPVPAGKPQLAVEPAAGASAESLTITFDINSSYLPASLNGRLRELASRLEPGKTYQVELIGSVGADPVANASAQEAARYNRWLAERRVSRVAEFLQRNAKSEALTIKQDFALNDSSRQVVVRVRSVP